VDGDVCGEVLQPVEVKGGGETCWRKAKDAAKQCKSRVYEVLKPS
jgi:hypothetical protein